MLYVNTFLSKLNEDAYHIDAKAPKLKPYQRKGARGLNRKSLRQVPNYARGRGDLNAKVEQMRKGLTKKVICSPSDVAYVQQRYNIKEIGNGKNLGTTGITIAPDPMSGAYMLIRR
tara:strand:+ start:490 stop:837 length:348 start_codon:yes stop_codon:yes gene_type:complete